MTVAQRLMLFIKDKNLNQTDLSNMIGVNRQTVNSWFKNSSKPQKLEYLLKILDAYPELRMEWLLLGKGEMYNNVNYDKFAPHKTEVGEEIVTYETGIKEKGKEKDKIIEALYKIIDEQSKMLDLSKTIIDSLQKSQK